MGRFLKQIIIVIFSYLFIAYNYNICTIYLCDVISV